MRLRADVRPDRGGRGGGRSGRFAILLVGKAWSIDRSHALAHKWRELVALALWSGGAWALFTWQATVELMAYGAVVAVAVAVILSPLGPVARPWRLLRPGRLGRVAAVVVTSTARIVWANVVMAFRVWSPSRPIRTGMLVVPTDLRSEGGLTTLGLLGSIIVDHQLVDLDDGRLQYHAVWVVSEDPEEARERINGRLERLIQPLEEHGR